MLSRLRALARPLVRLVASPLAAAGLAPDVLTLAAVPLAAAAAVLLGAGCPRGAFAAALAAVVVDALDGEVARLQAQATRYGSLLDATVDRVVEGLLLAGLAPAHPVAACLALLASTLVSYVKARTGLEIPLDNRDWPGVADRADRALLLLLAYALPARAGIALWVLAGLSTVGVLQRLRHARARIEAVTPR